MKILKRQLKFCALTCMFLPFNSSQFFKKVYFSFILMFTSIHLSSILFQSLMIFFTENSNELIDVIFFLSFTMLIAVRFCVLQLRRQKIIECWDILRSKEFMPQNQQEQRIEDFNEFMHKKFTVAMVIMTTSLATLLNLSPLFNEKSFTLPLRMWFPVKIGEENYKYFYFYQVIFMYTASVHTTAGGCLFTAITTEAWVQIDILAIRLRGIRDTIIDKYGNDILGDFRSTYGETAFVDLIKYHKRIYKLIETFNGIYYEIMFFQFSMPVLVVAFAIFKVSRGMADLIESFILLTYVVIVIIEAFLYCLFATLLTSKSEGLYFVIYDMDFGFLTRSSKLALIMMRRNLKPVLITAGPYIELTLVFFLKIMKVSYTALRMLTSAEKMK